MLWYMSELSKILNQINNGDAAIGAELLPMVYEELCKFAGARLRHEQPGQTPTATALVHEANLHLIGYDDDQNSAHVDDPEPPIVRNESVDQFQAR